MADSTARDYYSKYFGDYGKLWTKDIPRKIQAALLASEPVKRRAEADVKTAFALEPLGVRKAEADGLVVEAVARLDTRLIPVIATFDAQGTLVSFERGAA